MVLERSAYAGDTGVVVRIVALPLAEVVSAHNTLIGRVGLVVAEMDGVQYIIAPCFLAVECNMVVVKEITRATNQCLAARISNGVHAHRAEDGVHIVCILALHLVVLQRHIFGRNGDNHFTLCSCAFCRLFLLKRKSGLRGETSGGGEGIDGFLSAYNQLTPTAGIVVKIECFFVVFCKEQGQVLLSIPVFLINCGGQWVGYTSNGALAERVVDKI